jgi:hypothetical protein
MLIPVLIGVLLPASAAGHITVAIRAQPGAAGAASSTAVTITVSTPIAGGTVVRGLGHLELTGKAGEFWAPFDLETFRPVGPNTTSTLVVPTGAGRTVSIELAHLRWAKSISSFWPNQPLTEAVPDGEYSARVIIEERDRQRVKSKPIEVTISSKRGAAQR